MPRSQPAFANKSKIIAIMAGTLLSLLLTSCNSSSEEATGLASLAQMHLDQGQITEARQSIDLAIGMRDDSVDFFLVKGRIETAAKSLETAFSAYTSALALDPASQEALQAVATIGLQTGHVAEAERAADQLLALNPQQPNALIVKGLLALSSARFDAAAAYADRILSASPSDEGGIVLKGRALFMAGKEPDGIGIIESATSLSGPTPGLARIRLEMARAQSDASEMRKQFEVLRRLGVREAAAAIDEANLLYKTGERALARQAVEDELGQGNLPPNDVGRLMALWREYDPEAPSAEMLGRLSRLKGPVLEGVTRHLLEQGRPSDALKVLGSSSNAGLRAQALALTGKVAAAQALAEPVLAHDPAHCDANIAVAIIALSNGHAQAAAERGQRAAAECPRLTEAWIRTAQAYDRARLPRQAERVYRDGIDQNPQDLRLHKTFAEWLVARGDRAGAAAAARHLTRYAPSSPGAWELLGRICAEAACRTIADTGRHRASTAYLVDPASGELSRKGLYARMVPSKDRW